MKKHHLLAAFVMIIGLVLLLRQLPFGKNPAQIPSIVIGATNHQSIPHQSASVTTAPPNSASKAPPAIPTADNTNQTEQARAEGFRKSLEVRNVDISFWGQVVDQDKIALPGVVVKFKYLRYFYTGGVTGRDEWVNETVVSDGNGTFSLIGAKGGVLSMESLEKEGYEANASNQGFRYFGNDAFKPDISRPVVYKMWKKRGGETLIVGEKFLGIVPDGRTYTIDLISGQKMEGIATIGDLKVKIVRPTKVGPRDKFDWAAEIEGFGGGLIEVTDDDFMYLAPESGYAPSYSLAVNASDQAWKREVEKRFFFTSRDGKCFGQMTVKFIPDYNDKSVFSVKYSLNPASSRNLEYDWTKQIRPGDLK